MEKINVEVVLIVITRSGYLKQILARDWTGLNNTLSVDQYWETNLDLTETILDQMCPMKEDFLRLRRTHG